MHPEKLGHRVYRFQVNQPFSGVEKPEATLLRFRKLLKRLNSFSDRLLVLLSRKFLELC